MKWDTPLPATLFPKRSSAGIYIAEDRLFGLLAVSKLAEFPWHLVGLGGYVAGPIILVIEGAIHRRDTSTEEAVSDILLLEGVGAFLGAAVVAGVFLAKRRVRRF
jgi:hypothetical protein